MAERDDVVTIRTLDVLELVEELAAALAPKIVGHIAGVPIVVDPLAPRCVVRLVSRERSR